MVITSRSHDDAHDGRLFGLLAEALMNEWLEKLKNVQSMRKYAMESGGCACGLRFLLPELVWYWTSKS